MVSDEFCALPDGPVPSVLYNCIKGDPQCDKELQAMIDNCVSKGTDDAYYMLEAKRQADDEYLSKADIEALDKSIIENVNLPYGELRANHMAKNGSVLMPNKGVKSWILLVWQRWHGIR